MAFGRKKDEGPAPLESYDVTYKGGLAELPKAKIGKIEWQIWDDEFRLEPTTGSKKFWEPLVIPFAQVSGLDVVDRQVSTFEALASGRNGPNLQQANNIHISYLGESGPTVLRLEMLSGVTVMGQAKKCREMLDRLSAHQIPARFGGRRLPAEPSGAGAGDIPAQIAALAQLRDQGVLTDAEFSEKKAQLLARL